MESRGVVLGSRCRLPRCEPPRITDNYGAGQVDGGHAGLGLFPGSGLSPGWTGSFCGGAGFLVGAGAVLGSFTGANGAITGAFGKVRLPQSRLLLTGEGLLEAVLAVIYILLQVLIADNS